MESSFTFAVACVGVLLLISMHGSSGADSYGPWPGARPADDGTPVRSRPRDYRRVRIISPPTEREGQAPPSCGMGGAQRLTAELTGVPGRTPAYLGPTPLASTCRTDDLEVVADMAGPARASSHDPNSRGRNVSGLLAGVELTA